MTDAIETGAERPKTPIWFWIVAVLALIWNGAWSGDAATGGAVDAASRPRSASWLHDMH